MNLIEETPVQLIFSSLNPHANLFKQNSGINYILKPFWEEGIHAALTRYKNLAASFSQKVINPALSLPPREKNYQERFLT